MEKKRLTLISHSLEEYGREMRNGAFSVVAAGVLGNATVLLSL